MLNITERYFTVTHNNRTYTVIGSKDTTIDTIWASQKYFFMPGSIVVITDDKGISKRFIC